MQKVFYWLNETEEDDFIGDSNDIDADPDCVCPNIRDKNTDDTDVEISVNPLSSRLRFRSTLMTREIHHSSYYLGKNKVTKNKSSCISHNSCTHRRNIILHVPGANRVPRYAKCIIKYVLRKNKNAILVFSLRDQGVIGTDSGEKKNRK